jgi:hypothetical protein
MRVCALVELKLREQASLMKHFGMLATGMVATQHPGHMLMQTV